MLNSETVIIFLFSNTTNKKQRSQLSQNNFDKCAIQHNICQFLNTHSEKNWTSQVSKNVFNYSIPSLLYSLHDNTSFPLPTFSSTSTSVILHQLILISICNSSNLKDFKPFLTFCGYCPQFRAIKCNAPDECFHHLLILYADIWWIYFL